MTKDPLFFLEHIKECIYRIERFTNHVEEKDFLKDELIQSATIRQIEVIGEAVKNLPIDFINKYPHIPWGDIAGTRDKMIHYYFGVDLKLVWKIASDDLPLLKSQVEQIIKEIKSQQKKIR
jgi:uncharacterized protein with HEPN domain